MIELTLGILLLILIGLGLIEAHYHRLALSHLPIRIHVNGSRGKSSVTRLIAAGLRAGGLKTLAKTTGTAPRIIDENGSRKEFKKNRSGNVVTSTLDEAVLDEISRTTGGIFIRVENQVNAIAPLMQQLKQMEKKELKSHIFSQYEDRYQIFLFIGLLLFFTEFIIPTRTKEEMVWEGNFTKSK